jgi:hypothetical protein
MARARFPARWRGPLRAQGLDVFKLFNQVGLEVKRATGGQQQPWVSNSPIDGDFFFAPALDQSAVQAPPPAPPRRDQALRVPAPSLESGPAPTGAEATRALQEGEAAESRSDYGTALVWYKRAASLGSSDAAFDIGWLYQKGLGLAADPAQALQWYRRAAEAGHVMAANNLGVLYKNGLGTQRDYAEALRWYRRAAEAGNSEAQNNIGVMFNNGLGVERDYRQALTWFERSAEAGNAAAQVNIGILYKTGLGVEQNYVEAMRWFRCCMKTASVFRETTMKRSYGCAGPHHVAA